MNQDIVTKIIDTSVSELTEIIDGLQYLSRINTEHPFKIIDKEKFNYILSISKEINDKMYIFSRKDSGTQKKLMTLSFLYPADATYRVLYEILAQIEKKQLAIQESSTKIKEKYFEVQKLSTEIKKTPDELKKSLLQSEMASLQVQIVNSFSYLEAAVKEVGILSEAYEQIKENKNIPDDWDEYAFEESEIHANIENAFRNAVRDTLVNGRIGMGTIEYLEQFGISPFEAIKDVTDFIRGTNQYMSEGCPPDYDAFYSFLNQMAEKYKDCYKKAARRMGLSDDLISKRFVLSNTQGAFKNDSGDK